MLTVVNSPCFFNFFLTIFCLVRMIAASEGSARPTLIFSCLFYSNLAHFFNLGALKVLMALAGFFIALIGSFMDLESLPTLRKIQPKSD